MGSDWMREGVQNDAPFKPPEPGKLGTVLSIAAAIAVLVAFYVGYGWWDARRAAASRPDSTQPFSVQLPTAARSVAAPGSAPAPPTQRIHAAPASPPQVASEGMHKCVVQGRVLYTDEPCPPGAEASTVAQAPAPSRPSTITLYLCKATDGGLFWTRQHCHQRRAWVERTVTVPADRSFDEQVAWARERRAALAAPRPLPPVAMTERHEVAQDRTLQCKALNERVTRLDAYARQPLSAGQQDWARSERKKARDEQFRLHC
ncbi:MAG: DUF4124 domain-containing protein [Hydrogenophaga sp.]|jgi:hypothetical protein|nr:DUF4124 domain-containing protein [Hydrogenophaga sp.]